MIGAKACEAPFFILKKLVKLYKISIITPVIQFTYLCYSMRDTTTISLPEGMLAQLKEYAAKR